jgi:hypothetical protein
MSLFGSKMEKAQNHEEMDGNQVRMS